MSICESTSFYYGDVFANEWVPKCERFDEF
jgi:hypothetical protein